MLPGRLSGSAFYVFTDEPSRLRHGLVRSRLRVTDFIKFNLMPTSLFCPSLLSMLRPLTAAVCTGATLCLAPAAHAQSGEAEPIQTDRPDFVESSNVVGHGRVQIETSMALERTHDGAQRERVTTTPTLLRIGAGQDWEFRLETDGSTKQRAQDGLSGERTHSRGYADLSVGMKWHVRDQAGALPSMGVLMHADLDSGSAALRGKGVRPSLRVVAEWELPAGFSLGLMPGIAYEKTDDGRRFYQGIWGMVAGKAWTDRLRTFAEFAAPVIAHARHAAPVSTYNVGAAFLLSDDCQLDVAMQQGATRHAPDRAFSLGLSARF